MTGNSADLAQKFKERFAQQPRLFYAPGRVNLIGEHTDYNDGFVMPFAIDLGITVAAARRADNKIIVESLEFGAAVVDLDKPVQTRRGTWVDYVEGVARCIGERGRMLPGANLMIGSDLPKGAGLSSSAALEIALAMALSGIAEDPLDPLAMARLAQEVEHRFAGTQSGIMDPYTCVFGEHDACLLLDCRSLQSQKIPIEPAVSLVVCDTGIKHQLASSEYNLRRAECVSGLRQIKKMFPGAASLRDVQPSQFLQIEVAISEPERRRCRHVVTENQRTLEAAKAIQLQDFHHTGELMYASHESLSRDYEVSCPELDALVDIARDREGVFGARMTGGGFGGCTINLLRRGAFAAFAQSVDRFYSERFGVSPAIFEVRPSGGAHELNSVR